MESYVSISVVVFNLLLRIIYLFIRVDIYIYNDSASFDVYFDLTLRSKD